MSNDYMLSTYVVIYIYIISKEDSHITMYYLAAVYYHYHGHYVDGRGRIQELISCNSNVNSLGVVPIQPVAPKELALEVILLAVLVEQQEN